MINTEILNRQTGLIKNPDENTMICEKSTFEGLIVTLESIVDEYSVEFTYDDYVTKFLKDYYENGHKAEQINNNPEL